MGCSYLSTVAWSDNATSIAERTFYQCSRLENITLPLTLQEIKTQAFHECTALMEFTIPGSVKTIGWGAFYNCDNLVDIEIPDSVISISQYAFAFCNKLIKARFMGSAPTMGPDAFSYTDSNFHIEYYIDRFGFSSPLWNGYQAFDVGYSSPVYQWLSENNIPFEISLFSDPSESGVPLIVSYAFNLELGNYYSPIVPILTNDILSVKYYALRSDIKYTVEYSLDLITWENEFVTLTPLDSNGYRTASIPSDRKAFMRIGVQKK